MEENTEQTFQWYVTIENNKIIGATQSLSGEGFIDVPISDEFYNEFKTLKTAEEQNEKYKWNGTGIIPNPDYEQIIAEKEKKRQRQLLLEQIDDIDKKRIRAICEPSDKELGLTWLEYYNSQIQALREQLNNL